MTTRDREIGRYAWVMLWVGLVVGQLHALARFRTADGAGDLDLPGTSWWAVPADRALSPLLDWADPDLVYVTYGKVWLPVFVGFTLCALVVYRRRRPTGFERWAWRAALTGYALATCGAGLDYWTQWTGDYNGDGLEATLFGVGWLVTLPSFLLMLLTTTVLGVTLLVKGFRPRLLAVILALQLPLAFAIVMVTSMGSAALPVMVVFGVLGRRIARAEAPGVREPAVALSR